MYQITMVAMFQSLDFTSLTMKTLRSVVTFCHTANDRGTIARMVRDTNDGMMIAFLTFLAIVALIGIVALVWLAMVERAEKRALASTDDWYTHNQIDRNAPLTTIVDFASLNFSNQTLNMKGNR